jgi:hypothetical protein
MTRHLLSQGTLKGETTEEYMRRVAREKPPTKLPCRGCAYCGQDHRFAEQFWPAEELERCLKARKEKSCTR